MQEPTQGRPRAAREDFSLTEAAAVSGRSRVTIRRYLDAGRFPNAYRDTTSVRRPVPWRISADDLTRAGLPIAAPVIVHDTPQPSGNTSNGSVSSASDLEVEVAVLRAVATERDRLVGVLQSANEHLLRALLDLAHQRSQSSDAERSPDPS
jgi:hypothetical protein